jgi:hypothetical protein
MLDRSSGKGVRRFEVEGQCARTSEERELSSRGTNTGKNFGALSTSTDCTFLTSFPLKYLVFSSRNPLINTISTLIPPRRWRPSHPPYDPGRNYSEARSRSFQYLGKDGTFFKCSEAYVLKFLHNTMSWSARRATKAAQKLLENHEEILTNPFLREASVVSDHGISDTLRITTDQTRPSLYISKVRSERGTRQESSRFRQLARRRSEHLP